MSTDWKSMKVDRLILVAAISVLTLLAPVSALAGGAAGETCTGDHWSWASTMGADNIKTICQAWGGTLTGADAPDRTMHVIWGIIIFLVTLLLATVASKKFNQTGDEAILPDKSFGVFTVFELVGEFLYTLMKDMMGDKHARRFFPIIASLFFFILVSNLLGLFPGFLNATDNFNTTLALALIPFVLTHVWGVKEHGVVAYLKHFAGPMLALAPLMFIIEIISHLARPISLAIRLMGNMYGDHAVLGAFMGFGLLFVPLPVMVLGTIVCCVQALVFSLLSIVYIAMAVEHADDH
ncbi:MAG: F-type H+-transporting ATPase subunit a [Myxococcota bacterium]|jgi:F-type H+-transporting ATPase subunit a